jgi:uncharacterized protein
MKHIDTFRFCKDSSQLAGVFGVAELPRLAAEVLPNTDFEVRWAATGESPDGMAVALQSTVQMSCQRCLNAIGESIDVEFRFKFVKDEATAQADDEASDDVDMLVHDRQFDLYALIEDEMLMALPFVSLHVVCPSAGAIAHLPKEDKPNPFAVLKNMA